MTDIVVSIKGYATSLDNSLPLGAGGTDHITLDNESIYSVEGSNVEQLSDTARNARIKDLVTSGILRFAVRTKNSTSQALTELESFVARTAVASENHPQLLVRGDFTLTINGVEEKFEIQSTEQLFKAFADMKAKIETSIEAVREVKPGAPRFTAFS